jgi:hypothetical protein
VTWLRGGKRLRETRLWGLKLGLIYYPPQVLIQRGFKIVFYDPSDVKVGEIGSDVLAGRASSIEFELMDFGCGAWSLTLEDRPGFDIGYRTRIDIHPYFSDLPWFSGFVQDRPKEGTARPVVYSGFGFYEQLDWVRVTGSYAALDIAEIVKNIIGNMVAPNTQIIYNAAKVETTGYTVNSISFDHTPAKDAIQTLAETAQNFEYGVDSLREFYFRAVIAEVKEQYWIGKHLAGLDIEEDPKPIRNRLYVKVGQIQAGGTNYIGSVENGASILAHGLHEDEITAPEILNNTDALQWANYLLNQKKDPLVRAQLRDIFLDDTKVKIDAVGKVRITTGTGTEYTLAIKRVQYKINAAGILADIELGQILIPFEQHIVSLLRRITDEQRLGDKRTQQLYP